MQDEALNTLFLVIESNPALVGQPKETAFMRARLHPALRRFSSGGLVCSQSFKPYAAPLEALNYNVRPIFKYESNMLDVVLCLPGRQKEENLFDFAIAMRTLKPNGVLICSMENEIGAARFEKNLATLAGNIETVSKNKCRVFWARKTAQSDMKLQEEWEAAGQIKQNANGFFTAPGMFSWEQIDKGSQLLADNLPTDLRGHGADFGAGYGFLSCQVLKKCPKVTRVDLVDGDYFSLEAAKMNVTALGGSAAVNYHWHDLTQGPPLRNLDWLVANPPFHIARRTEPELGKSFIRAAFEALKKGASCYLVANQHLPYDTLIREIFTSQKQLASGGGFKVIEASR